VRWKSVRRTAAISAVATGLACASLTGSAAAFRAEVIPHTTDFDVCHFESGDVPGVNVDFEIAAHGQLPAGYTLQSTIIGPLPCFEFGNGQVVATRSGEVSATCHFSSD
jgi:hypothetical protein